MKWLKRKIRRWLAHDEESVGLRVHDPREQSRPYSDPVLNFRIYSAENGKILEFSRYDQVKDRTYSTNYIINKDENISEKVDKCLKVELMR